MLVLDLDQVLVDSMADSAVDNTAEESAMVVDNTVVGSAADSTAAGLAVDNMEEVSETAVDNTVVGSAADNTVVGSAADSTAAGLVVDNMEEDLEADDMEADSVDYTVVVGMAEATADCTAAGSAVDMVAADSDCLAAVSDLMDPEPIAPWLQLTPEVPEPRLELIV